MVQEVECYDYAAGANPETDEDGSFWDYQWCTEQFQPFSKDGKNDMYWDQVLPLSTHAVPNLVAVSCQRSLPQLPPCILLGMPDVCLLAFEGPFFRRIPLSEEVLSDLWDSMCAAI